jgi:nitric oxide reductase subunit B
VGGSFSALEPFPILLMVYDTWRDIKHRKEPMLPKLTWVYLVGGVILHFLGAGLFGFAHTLPQINYYTHGSQVTVSHGHLACYGAYVLLNLTFNYFAIPRIKAFPGFAYDEKTGHTAFWLTSLGVLGMSLAFAVAGVLQTYLERVQGQPYMLAAQPIRFWMFIAFVHGLVVVAGVFLVIKQLLTLEPAPQPAAA